MKPPAIEEVDGNTLEGKRAIVESLRRDLEHVPDYESISSSIFRINKRKEISDWQKRMVDEHGVRE